MREIMFRGKDVDNGAWIYGYYIGPVGLDESHEICDISDPCGSRTDVAPDTVGQYTGLTDFNGKKIFEGDVIRAHYANVPPEKCEDVEQVVFRNGRFCGLYARGTMKMWAALPDGIPHLSSDKSVWMDWCEVIGNIYDNPDLMKER